MGLSHIVSDVLKLPEPSARFLLALYSGELVPSAHIAVCVDRACLERGPRCLLMTERE